MLEWLKKLFFFKKVGFFFFFSLKTLHILANLEEGVAFLTLGAPWKEIDLFEKNSQEQLQNPKIWEIHFQAIAKMGNLNDWEYAKKLLLENFDEKSEVKEEVAWALLSCRTKSTQPRLRALAYFSASLAEDARSVEMLIQGLSDPHKKVREMVASQMVRFPDEKAKEALKKTFQKETDPEVRLAIINALSTMLTKDMVPLFLHILKVGTEKEQERVLKALLDEEIALDLEENENLPTPSMRALFCTSSEKEEEIRKALSDRHPVVRALALEKLVGLGKALTKETLYEIKKRKNDPDFRVRLLAHRLLFLSGDLKEGEFLLSKLKAYEEQERLFAASLISSLGFKGRSFLKKAFDLIDDPFILATLCWEMPLEEIPKKAIDALREIFFEKKSHVVLINYGSFSFFAPLTLSKEAFNPIEEDLLALQALDKIAALDPSHTEEVLFSFLKRSTQGLSAPLTGLLLQEGSSLAREKLKQIFKKAPLKQRLEIAFVLVLFGEKEEFLPIFYSAYEKADLHTKQMILEALLRMEERASAPFLFQWLSEDKARLSTMAAGVYLRLLFR